MSLDNWWIKIHSLVNKNRNCLIHNPNILAALNLTCKEIAVLYTILFIYSVPVLIPNTISSLRYATMMKIRLYNLYSSNVVPFLAYAYILKYFIPIQGWVLCIDWKISIDYMTFIINLNMGFFNFLLSTNLFYLSLLFGSISFLEIFYYLTVQYNDKICTYMVIT